MYPSARAYSQRNEDFGAQLGGETRLAPALGPRYAAGSSQHAARQMEISTGILEIDRSRTVPDYM
jgi:hypothetical protein